MYLTQKNWEKLAYQLFLEPKGEWFAQKDQWKENFLLDIKSRMITETIWEDEKIRITWVKFYMSSKENEFIEDFDKTIEQ
jgi:type III restriction enzyme